MRVRRFKPADAEQCSRLQIKNFSTVNRKVYHEATIRQLIKDATPKKTLAKSKERNYFVAVEKGKVIGIGGYAKDNIHTFFVEPSMYRRGVGKALLARTLKEAKKEGICVMKCSSSPNAEKFYASCGFRRLKKKKIPFHGSMLTFIDMRKTL